MPVERQTDSLGRERVMRGAGHGKRFGKDDALMTRDAQMLALSAAGATAEEIAESYGITKRNVQQRLREARKKWPPGQRSADIWREAENMKLDESEARLLAIIRNPGVAYGSSGRPVLDPETGKPILNRHVVIAGERALGQVRKRRAELNGLDIPVVQHINVTTTPLLDEEIERLADELAAHGRAGQPQLTGIPEWQPVSAGEDDGDSGT